MTFRSDLLNFVQTTLVKRGGEVGPEESLIELGVIDSIGLMQLLAFIEENTGVRIPDHMVTPQNFQSVVAMETMVSDLKSA